LSSIKQNKFFQNNRLHLNNMTQISRLFIQYGTKKQQGYTSVTNISTYYNLVTKSRYRILPNFLTRTDFCTECHLFQNIAEKIRQNYIEKNTFILALNVL